MGERVGGKGSEQEGHAASEGRSNQRDEMKRGVTERHVCGGGRRLYSEICGIFHDTSNGKSPCSTFYFAAYLST